MINRQLFLMHQAQTTEFPVMLEISHAHGNYLFDVQGKKYLDLISGISVSHIGHGNVQVKDAIIEQLNKHQHVMIYGEFVQSAQVNLAQALTQLLPQNLDSVYLLNSGAEATDVALKLAKRVTQRPNIMACKNAYHGSTHAALSLNSDAYYKDAFRPLLPGVSFIEFNNIASLKAINEQTACVVCEVIQSEAGYVWADPNFLKALRARCTELGVLLIFDEIQSGLGKTGTLFAFEQIGVVPDILLLGKALGAGMPIGAVVASKDHMMLLANNPILGHITTFGGHPVVAAAAKAGLDVLLQNNFLADIPAKEQLFRSLLVHPEIKQVSGKGLMLSVALSTFEFTLATVKACQEKGLITDWFLFANNRLRIAPPLTITLSEIEEACAIMIAAITETQASMASNNPLSS
jgi:acetylornithine/succinyldiaminopimelate/putrescine aminotransferase